MWFINLYRHTIQPLTGLSPMSSSVLSMGSFSRQSRTMSRLMRGSDARSMSSSSSSSSESTAVSGKPLRSMSPGSFSVAWNKETGDKWVSHLRFELNKVRDLVSPPNTSSWQTAWPKSPAGPVCPSLSTYLLITNNTLVRQLHSWKANKLLVVADQASDQTGVQLSKLRRSKLICKQPV